MKENNFLENDISKRKKKKKNIKKIIVCLILIIIIPFCLYSFAKLIKHPSNTYVVTNGKITSEETLDGYIVREETIVEGNNSGKEMDKVKQEGERVAKGDTVFRYASSQENELKQQITKVDEEIQKIIEENNSSIFSSDKKILESQILNEMDKIYQKNEFKDIKECKNNINNYLSKKAKILGEDAPSDSYLKQLINQRSKYEETLKNVSEDVQAPDAGMTSYKVDGLESVLQVNNLDKLNKAFLDNLNLTSGQTINSSNEKGKIVNNYYCYIIYNSKKEEAKNIKINDKIKIKLFNNEEISTKVINIIEEADDSRTITIEIKSNTEELIGYRKISFDVIWWSTEGFRVPNSSIIEEKNIKYVIRNRNGYLNKMPIKVLKQDEEYSIVSGYTKTELLNLNLSEDEISETRTITLYDSIQLEPNK